jgi:tRNA pseudouridine38-40 synthase
VLDADEVPVSFHPTLDALSKRYRYRIDNARIADPMKLQFAHHVPLRLDEQQMQLGANFIIGRHDFAAFQTVGSERLSTVRTVFACDVFRQQDEIQIEVEADGFLYNMVRTIAGTLILVGSGRWSPQSVSEIIASADRKKAGPTAPAKGLAMLWVRYSI